MHCSEYVDVAITYNNLGNVYSELDDPYFYCALGDCLKKLGPDHADFGSYVQLPGCCTQGSG